MKTHAEYLAYQRDYYHSHQSYQKGARRFGFKPGQKMKFPCPWRAEGCKWETNDPVKHRKHVQEHEAEEARKRDTAI